MFENGEHVCREMDTGPWVTLFLGGPFLLQRKGLHLSLAKANAPPAEQLAVPAVPWPHFVESWGTKPSIACCKSLLCSSVRHALGPPFL